MQIYLMFNQQLELEAEDNCAGIRVATDVSTLARFMEWVKVVSRVTSRIDMNLPKAKAFSWRYACHECPLPEILNRALPNHVIQGDELWTWLHPFDLPLERAGAFAAQGHPKRSR